MATAPTPVHYYRNTRYLPKYEPMFAVAQRDSPFPSGTEFRLDGDHWQELDTDPVARMLFHLDPYLDYTDESDMPLPLTPETARLLP